jgi:hypothetical protein
MPRKLSPPDAARRRYAFVQAAVLGAFAIAMLLAGMLLPRATGGLQRWLLAVAPLGLLALWAWNFFKVIRDDDEMMRAFYLRVVAISAVMVLLLGTMYGIVERLLGAPAFPAFLLLPTFAALFGIVSVLSRGR